MKEINTRGFPMVIVFVILLMIITVISWKSCSSDVAAMSEMNGSHSVFITLAITSKL